MEEHFLSFGRLQRGLRHVFVQEKAGHHRLGGNLNPVAASSRLFHERQNSTRAWHAVPIG